MEFKIQSNFMPNLNNSERLKIVEVSPQSVIVQMDNSNNRGVFPLDNFQYWIRKKSLIHISEQEEQAEKIESTGN